MTSDVAIAGVDLVREQKDPVRLHLENVPDDLLLRGLLALAKLLVALAPLTPHSARVRTCEFRVHASRSTRAIFARGSCLSCALVRLVGTCSFFCCV